MTEELLERVETLEKQLAGLARRLDGLESTRRGGNGKPGAAVRLRVE